MIMEIYFCIYLLECLWCLVLFVCCSVDESNIVVMLVLFNVIQFFCQFLWVNVENYMVEGFGDLLLLSCVDGWSSDFCLGYCDFNGLENWVIIFFIDQKYYDILCLIQSCFYGEYLVSLNISGGVIVQVIGFDECGVEIIVFSNVLGVKNVIMCQLIEFFMDEWLCNCIFIVCIEDQYRYCFEYMQQGL